MLAPHKFIVEDKNYQSTALDVFVQFHIVRRLAPVIGNLIMLREGLLRPGDVLAPLVEGLSKLSDVDCEYVLHNCLSVTSRDAGNGTYSSVYNFASKRMMYDDIAMPAMMQIAWEVLEANLGDFTAGMFPQPTQVIP